jgi:hypothetical protein
VKITAMESKPGRIWSISVGGVTTRFSLVKILSAIDGVQFTRKPTLFSVFKDESFGEFMYKENLYALEAEWPAFNSFEIYLKRGGCKPETSDLLEKLSKA